jgi:hypothetical protein
VAGQKTDAELEPEQREAVMATAIDPCCFRLKGQTRPKRRLLCRPYLLVHLPNSAVTVVAQNCAEGAVKLRCVAPEELLPERAKVRPHWGLS